jgi:hypothetical protein
MKNGKLEMKNAWHLAGHFSLDFMNKIGAILKACLVFIRTENFHLKKLWLGGT